MIFLHSAGGYRQISTIPRFQAHPPGFLHWSRGPCSRVAGGSIRTGTILKARSAGGVSGSLVDRWSNPSSLMQGSPSSLPSSSPQTGVVPKIPKLHKTRQSPNRCPAELQKPSINHYTPLMEGLWAGWVSHGRGGATLSVSVAGST